MEDHVLQNFDWSCYYNPARSRFLDGREGVFWSNGFNNIICASVICGLCWWALRLWYDFASINHVKMHLRTLTRVMYLKDMAAFMGDLMLLTKEHFNSIMKLQNNVAPLPIARIRMPGTLIARTLRLQTGPIAAPPLLPPESAEVTSEAEDAQLAACLDGLEVSFTMDCNRTTFVSAHWGVPISVMQGICVDNRTIIDLLPTSTFSVRRFLRSLCRPYYGDGIRDLLDAPEDPPVDPFYGADWRHGRFSVLAYSEKLCSSEVVCVDAGTGVTCTVSPPLKTVDVGAEQRSIWEVLLSGSYGGEEIIPLVLVLYSPRTHDARVFSEGSVESYQGIAQLTLVSFRGSIRPPASSVRRSAGLISLSVDSVRQVSFSNDFRRPQEQRDMFGMGDEVDTECLICLANRMDTVLLPCGHASFCYGCLQSLRSQRCPVCRGAFTSYIRFPLEGVQTPGGV
ncbi:E3 ubiquitin-protein ligase, putative [Babesia caballi]|uniref:E3 ubiquitin-protein ligase, putative n=1 Tax=Babesia caballi TaxID=5871 RepID=A0AAV4M060_BABCB|nr:E3 ubiquitin-protein ligase, putative [Babesia caballi]